MCLCPQEKILGGVFFPWDPILTVRISLYPSLTLMLASFCPTQSQISIVIYCENTNIATSTLNLKDTYDKALKGARRVSVSGVSISTTIKLLQDQEAVFFVSRI